MTKEFQSSRAIAQDLGSLLSIAQAGVLLELPGVRRELSRLRGHLRARLDRGRGAVPEDLLIVYQGALAHVSGLLDDGHRHDGGVHDGRPQNGSGATPETIARAKGDWLAAQRRAGRLPGEQAEALDHLFELWHEIRKSLQEATIPFARLFRQKTRKAALLPLERLPERQAGMAMDLWLTWARRWRAQPAVRGNQKQTVDTLQVVELLIMQGRDPRRVEALYELPAGRAEELLRLCLEDYAKNLQIYLDKTASFK